MAENFKEQKGYTYSKNEEAEELVKHLVKIKMFEHLQPEKMAFINSKKIKKKEKVYANTEAGRLKRELDEEKAKRKFIARTVTLNKFWKTVYMEKTVLFIIETADEWWSKLSKEDKIKVIVHECFHIPSDFEMGSLVQHDEFKIINKLYAKYNKLVGKKVITISAIGQSEDPNDDLKEDEIKKMQDGEEDEPEPKLDEKDDEAVESQDEEKPDEE